MRYALIVVAYLIIVSCQNIIDLSTKQKELPIKGLRGNINNPSIERAHKLWKKMNARHYDESANLQKDCIPRLFHSKTGTVKGVIVLFHGYTACPQQFFSWAEKLSNESIEVLLPLQPGHGYNMQNGKDVIDALPDNTNYQIVYSKYVENINEVMRAYPPNIEKYVGGISLGATIATDTLNHAPKLYDRAIIVTPSFDFSNLLARISLFFVSSLAKIPLLDGFPPIKTILNSSQGWGEACEYERREGRAGNCDFLAKHAVGMHEYGRKVADEIRQDIKTRTQFIMVEEDKAVMNSTIVKVYKQFNDASICSFPSSIDHSLISKFDNPNIEMWWLDDMLKKFNIFLNRADFVPSQIKNRLKSCQISDSTNNTN